VNINAFSFIAVIVAYPTIFAEASAHHAKDLLIPLLGTFTPRQLCWLTIDDVARSNELKAAEPVSKADALEFMHLKFGNILSWSRRKVPLFIFPTALCNCDRRRCFVGDASGCTNSACRTGVSSGSAIDFMSYYQPHDSWVVRVQAQGPVVERRGPR
jgi:hypothetical protein